MHVQQPLLNRVVYYALQRSPPITPRCKHACKRVCEQQVVRRLLQGGAETPGGLMIGWMVLLGVRGFQERSSRNEYASLWPLRHGHVPSTTNSVLFCLAE